MPHHCRASGFKPDMSNLISSQRYILNVPKEGIEPSQAFATPDPKSGRYAKILVLRHLIVLIAERLDSDSNPDKLLNDLLSRQSLLLAGCSLQIWKDY